MIELKGKRYLYLAILLVMTSLLATPITAQTTSKIRNKRDSICGVYFTGVGCPHCAAADPILLDDYPFNYPSLIVIEYEIYQTPGNGQVLNTYLSNAKIGRRVPQMIIGGGYEVGERAAGDGPTSSWTKKKLESLDAAECRLSDGSQVSFQNLDINNLPGRPKIWRGNRVLIKAEDHQPRFATVEPQPVAISQGKITFDHAVKMGDWILQWNGDGVGDFDHSYSLPAAGSETVYVESNQFLKQLVKTGSVSQSLKASLDGYDQVLNKGGSQEGQGDTVSSDLTPGKAIELALADAVNPCAIAVMIIMLTAIINYNPEDKKKVLLAGFAFVTAIFSTYLFYGVVIVNLFKSVQSLFTEAKPLIYLLVGVFASLLGVLNISDYINYKPGGFLTEMPMFLRPRMKKVINGVTSPRGAALTGIFVTLFLLPCTIGPYIAALGMLSFFEFLETLPWLLFYNLIFVSPMIAITILIYRGAAEVEDVSDWRDRNIKYLHLGAGIVIFGVGACMALAGLVPFLKSFGVGLTLPISPLSWNFIMWPLVFGLLAPYLAHKLERGG